MLAQLPPVPTEQDGVQRRTNEVAGGDAAAECCGICSLVDVEVEHG